MQTPCASITAILPGYTGEPIRPDLDPRIHPAGPIVYWSFGPLRRSLIRYDIWADTGFPESRVARYEFCAPAYIPGRLQPIDPPATIGSACAVNEITFEVQQLIQVSRFKGFYRGAAVRPSDLWPTLRLFGPKGWIVAAVGAIGASLALGVPSAIINNPFFIRMIPVRAEDYVIWIVTSVLLGFVLGTFAISPTKGNGGKALGSGILTYLAVGCPICNKLVILFLGLSGALAYFEPVQLYLGIGSVLFLVWTLLLRARSVSGACPT